MFRAKAFHECYDAFVANSERFSLINRGEIETKNLSECLKVDFEILYRNVFPKSKSATIKKLSALKEIGILKRMSGTAEIILDEQGLQSWKTLSKHPSDTVRGWGAFIIGIHPEMKFEERFKLMKIFADDPHFGVREWSWMALRKHIAGDLIKSISILSAWTSDKSFRVRRFSSEATRPRGVWAEHLNELKKNPEMALSILSPLKADSEKYVQDSVGNWLNDAAKSEPIWVKKLCSNWKKESPTKETAYIIKRAIRSI